MMIVLSLRTGISHNFNTNGTPTEIYRLYRGEVELINVTERTGTVRVTCKKEEVTDKRKDGKYPEGYMYDHDVPGHPDFVVCKIEFELIIPSDILQAINEQVAIHGKGE